MFFILQASLLAVLTHGYDHGRNKNFRQLLFQEIQKKFNSIVLPKLREIDGNAYIDQILDEARDEIKSNNLDPYEIVDDDGSQVQLKGFIGGFSTMHRVDDAQVTETAETLTITNTLRVVNLEGDFNWTASFLDINYNGDADVLVDSVDLYLQLDGAINESSTVVYLNITTLDIEDIGRISVEVHGFGLLDEIIDIVANYITNLIKVILPAIFDGIVKDALQTVLDNHPFPLPTE